MRILLLILTLVNFGCASSSYYITSNPSGANVYYFDPGTQKKFLLGATPIEYSKSSIPTDGPFMMSFEKEGFHSQEVPVTNSDEAKTVVNVKMKPDPEGVKDDAVLNGILTRLFKAQGLIFKKQYQAAIIDIDKVIEERPGISQAYVMKGTAYYMLKEMPSAIEAWKKALKMEPNNDELKQFLVEKNIDLK